MEENSTFKKLLNFIYLYLYYKIFTFLMIDEVRYGQKQTRIILLVIYYNLCFRKANNLIYQILVNPRIVDVNERRGGPTLGHF